MSNTKPAAKGKICTSEFDGWACTLADDGHTEHVAHLDADSIAAAWCGRQARPVETAVERIILVDLMDAIGDWEDHYRSEIEKASTAKDRRYLQNMVCVTRDLLSHVRTLAEDAGWSA